MNDAWISGIHFARCFKPGIDRGCEDGLYGNRGLMQLDVKNVNLVAPGAICPAGAAVVKKPL